MLKVVKVLTVWSNAVKYGIIHANIESGVSWTNICLYTAELAVLKLKLLVINCPFK